MLKRYRTENQEVSSYVSSYVEIKYLFTEKKK